MLKAAALTGVAALTRYTANNMDTTCFDSKPALRWWAATRPEHLGGNPACECASGGYCSSVASFQRWMSRTGIDTARNVRVVAPFDEWSADKVACAAGVHPSVWWPEWFNSE